MLTAEKLMAVTGIFPSKGHPSDQDLLAVDALDARWKSRAKRWLRMYDEEKRKPAPFESPDPPEERKLQDKLLAQIAGENDVNMLGGIPDPELGAEYVETVKAACRYIDSKWPKIPVPGAVAEVFPLSKEELDDAYALVRIADNPEILWDELGSESLSIPMIECWRTCYPEWSAEVLTMLEGLVIERVAKKLPLEWQHQDFIHMLRGEDLEATLEIAKNQPPQQTNGAT
jgi:hypothetical protein